MPTAYKEAIATPLITKASFDPEFANFRQVSNLPFISKLIERVVSEQINAFTEKHGLDEPLQSAFKTKQPTETALVKVQNDILCAFKEQKVVLLALLDLSAAFDTCNHRIPLTRLECEFNISATALEWFRSYLAARRQRVTIKSTLSDPVCLERISAGVGLGPQGIQ